ncbi:hypothetical protein ES703_41358 [subsurface metagenome]
MQPCLLYNHCIHEKCRWWLEKPTEDTNCIFDLFPLVRDQVLKLLADLEVLADSLAKPDK